MTASQPPHHTSAPDPTVTTAGPPPAPTDHSLKQTERPHPLTPFVRGWLIFVAIAIGWGREIVTSAGEDQLSAGGLTWIEVAGDRKALDNRLGDAQLPVRVVDGPVGVVAMGIGERELRNP